MKKLILASAMVLAAGMAHAGDEGYTDEGGSNPAYENQQSVDDDNGLNEAGNGYNFEFAGDNIAEEAATHFDSKDWGDGSTGTPAYEDGYVGADPDPSGNPYWTNNGE